MEIKIGITNIAREVTFETDATPDTVRGQIEQAVADNAALLTLSDTKGRQYLVSTESISYVELGAEAGRKVGFVS